MVKHRLPHFTALLSGAALATTTLLTARVPLMTPSEAQPLQAGDNLRAPDFPTNFTWLNTPNPLSLRGLRGKVVLLDFWTYGCINCMHVVPDLKRLERKYPNELVVIGVHSAKFANESRPENVRQAVLRFGLEHPVVVDQNMRLWDAYTVRAWPTFVVIDPNGRIAGSTAGEGQYATLDDAIGKLVAKFGKKGDLNRTPLKLALESAKTPRGPLAFPAKVLADAASQRLFIADSGHNRILICDLNGHVTATAGTGAQGLKDGGFDEAQFFNPHGMALQRAANGDLTLYVADTDNHAIRALDLQNGTVKTVAGTGQQASYGAGGGAALKTPLSSPWDVLLRGDDLLIAMAGPHQIWNLNFATNRVAPFAGSGVEARQDGTLSSAAFAQPSGLTLAGNALYVADAESSTLRAVNLQGGTVRTLAGGDLFDFGDKDGRGDTVRLQHPLGVAYAEGKVYVADAYNHKIKVLDPQTGEVGTFVGNTRGLQDGSGTQAHFDEPGGLSVAGNTLYVADTNNGAIRRVDLPTKAVTTLKLTGVPTPLPAEPARAPQTTETDGLITLPSATLAPNQKGELVLDVQLPAQHHLNTASPQRVFARVEGGTATLSKNALSGTAVTLPLRVPLQTGAAGTSGAVVLSATIYYCSDNDKICKVQSFRLRAPFTVQPEGTRELRLATKLEQ